MLQKIDPSIISDKTKLDQICKLKNVKLSFDLGAVFRKNNIYLTNSNK